jgi:hypothetical protein
MRQTVVTRKTFVGPVGALLCFALVLTACSSGGGPTSAAHAGSAPHSAAPGAPPAASPTAAAQSGLLFAALEPEGFMGKHSVVAIVGLDGYARARATFAPRRPPELFDAATVVQPEARIAAGGVLYVDGAGHVRRLAIGGGSTDVATFPIGAQQELSFASSGDGSHLVAVRFSFPPLANPPPSDPSTGRYAPGDFSEDVLAADAGQAQRVLSHQSWPQSTSSINMLAIVGWTAAGPLATANTAIGTQDPAPGQRLFGKLVHLDAAGRPGPVLGGPDCGAWDFLPDDTVLCGSDDYRAVSIRNAAGQPQFTLSNPGSHQYGDLTLAPDGSRITVRDLAQDHASVVDRAGQVTALPSGFEAQGWLDGSTVVGVGPQAGILGYIRVDQPTRIVDLGFKGVFLGPVSG